MDPQSTSPTAPPPLAANSLVQQPENVSQVPNQVPPPPLLDSKSKIIYIVVGVIVLIIVLVLVGLFIFKSKVQTQNAALSQQIPKPSLTPTSSTVATSSATINIDTPKDWLVYKNTKVGFQVSYPPNYSKPTTQTHQPPYLTDANGQEDGDLVIGGDSQKGFLISIVPAQTGATLDDYFNASLMWIPPEQKNAFKKDKIIVDGVSGLKIVLAETTTQAIFRTKTHFITLNNHLPPLPTISNEKEFNTMINSFKFQEK